MVFLRLLGWPIEAHSKHFRRLSAVRKFRLFESDLLTGFDFEKHVRGFRFFAFANIELKEYFRDRAEKSNALWWWVIEQGSGCPHVTEESSNNEICQRSLAFVRKTITLWSIVLRIAVCGRSPWTPRVSSKKSDDHYLYGSTTIASANITVNEHRSRPFGSL